LAERLALRGLALHARYEHSDRGPDQLDGRHLNSTQWRIIGASAIGLSHELTETRCQDAHRVVLVPLPDGEVVVAAVADGAGSAKYSHIGAVTTAETATGLVEEHLLAAGGAAGLQEDDLIRILQLTREAVLAEAMEHEHDPREFAATLLLAVLFPDRTLAAHIGDGAIVVDDGMLRCLSWPEQGEYANMTVFLTMENAVENARLYQTEAVTRFALFSDGLQSLALSYATQEVYAPFIEPMLKPLGNPAADAVKLQGALAAYLTSETINGRTDDDKTLVLGVRIGA
jgi:hypothetical protein